MGHPDWLPASKSALSFKLDQNVFGGAGNTVVWTVPPGEQWRLLLVRGDYIAGGAVANRMPILFLLTDLPENIYEIGSPAFITAGQTRRIAFAANVGARNMGADGIQETIPLPEVYVLGDWQVTLSMTNFQAADHIDNAAILAERIAVLT